jgi:hypothetical protein
MMPNVDDLALFDGIVAAMLAADEAAADGEYTVELSDRIARESMAAAQLRERLFGHLRR